MGWEGWGAGALGPYDVQLQVVAEAGGAVHSHQDGAPLVRAEAHGQAVHSRAGPVIGGPRVGNECPPLPKNVRGPGCREKEREKDDIRRARSAGPRGCDHSTGTANLGFRASAGVLTVATRLCGPGERLTDGYPGKSLCMRTDRCSGLIKNFGFNYNKTEVTERGFKRPRRTAGCKQGPRGLG